MEEDSQEEATQSSSHASAHHSGDEIAYSSHPLTGAYESLNVCGGRPLFVLKEAWDDKPRSRKKPLDTQYHQVLDPRTRLQLFLYSNSVLSELPSAIVEWKNPVDQVEEEDEKEDESEDANQNTTEASDGQSAYASRIALLHADIAGWSADNSDEDEVLSIDSSDDGNSNEDTGSSTTFYYPLFPTPNIKNPGIRQKLQDLVDGKYPEESQTRLPELAARMLAEIDRVNSTPTLCPGARRGGI